MQQFQEVEEEHVCQMTDFVDTYIKAWENQHVLLGQVLFSILIDGYVQIFIYMYIYMHR